ncbi:LysR family transcriptional regulator [Pseudokineococcus sp. 1T1Z-3]|uniref:LysR family transcriptional regulator n=1 Tax=Pseudokineococcus sp. 1T1Z-3 TaxID=3132745 RepID=UPI00309E5582
MDVDALAALAAVRSQGGVTKAAAVLHVSPSAVSQRLAALTRAAGTPLTERDGRRLRLTPAGHALADAALDVAASLERARTAARDVLARPSGVVRVSAFSSGAELLLPGLLTRLARFPDVVVECSDEDVALEDFAALTDRLDVVIAHRPETQPAWTAHPRQVRTRTLLREPLDVAVPTTHPLAARESLTPDDLLDEPWIAVREGFPVAAVLHAVAGQHAPARIVHRVNDFHVVLSLVAAGHGLSLLPRHTCGHHPDVRLLPLTGVRAGRLVDALVRPDKAERPLVRLVLDELGDLAREVAPDEH